MDGKTSVRYLQNYIKSKDHNPALKKDYFLKLSEEVGELASAMRKDLVRGEDASVIGTIDEEVWDVIYYAIAIANGYGIDLERTIQEKEACSAVKYGHSVPFETGR